MPGPEFKKDTVTDPTKQFIINQITKNNLSNDGLNDAVSDLPWLVEWVVNNAQSLIDQSPFLVAKIIVKLIRNEKNENNSAMLQKLIETIAPILTAKENKTFNDHLRQLLNQDGMAKLIPKYVNTPFGATFLELMHHSKIFSKQDLIKLLKLCQDKPLEYTKAYLDLFEKQNPNDKELNQIMINLIFQARYTKNWTLIISLLERHPNYRYLGEVLLHAVDQKQTEVVDALIKMGSKIIIGIGGEAPSVWHFDKDESHNVFYLAIMNEDSAMFIKLLKADHDIKVPIHALKQLLLVKPTIVAQIVANLMVEKNEPSDLVNVVTEEVNRLGNESRGMFKEAFIQTVRALGNQEKIDAIFQEHIRQNKFAVTNLLLNCGVSSAALLTAIMSNKKVSEDYFKQFLKQSTQDQDEGIIAETIKDKNYLGHLTKRFEDNLKLNNKAEIDAVIKNIQDNKHIPNFLMQMAIVSHNWFLMEALALRYPDFLEDVLSLTIQFHQLSTLNILLNAGITSEKIEEILLKLKQKFPTMQYLYVGEFLKSNPEKRKNMLKEVALHGYNFFETLYTYKEKTASGTHAASNLEEKEADTLQRDYQTALLNASQANDMGAVNQLVEGRVGRGFTLNFQDKDGNTALHWAVKNNNEDMVSKLLKAGINAHTTNHDGNTGLHLAISQNNFNIAKELADPVGVNIVNIQGITPIRLAANMNHLFIEQYCRSRDDQQRKALVSKFKSTNNIDGLNTALLEKEKEKKKLARRALANHPREICQLAMYYEDHKKPHKAMLFYCIATAYADRPSDVQYCENKFNTLKIDDIQFKKFLLDCMGKGNIGRSRLDKLRKEHKNFGPIQLILLAMNELKSYYPGAVHQQLKDSILSTMHDAGGISKKLLKVTTTVGRLTAKYEELIQQNNIELDNIIAFIETIPRYIDDSGPEPTAPILSYLEIFKPTIDSIVAKILNWSPTLDIPLEANQDFKLARDLILFDLQKFLDLEKDEKFTPSLRFKKTAVAEDFGQEAYLPLKTAIKNWLNTYSGRSEEEINHAVSVIMDDVQVSLGKGKIITKTETKKPGFFEKGISATEGASSVPNPEDTQKTGPTPGGDSDQT